MKVGRFKKVTLLFTACCFLTSPFAFSATLTPALLNTKKDAEANGYMFFATHDEIVAMAKKEGKLTVSSGLEPTEFKPLINAFQQKYPFITDVHVEEILGIEAYQRFILEIQSGQAKGWDVIFIPIDFAKEYMPHLMKHDIYGMAKQGVLKIHPGMVHPGERNIVSVISTITTVPYNRKLISEDKVPHTWEDFLKPEFKGKKFVMDIRPLNVAPLVPAWGLERTLEFARKVAAQQPVWGRGATKINSAIISGEYSLFVGSSFSSVKRAMGKDSMGNLSYKIVEPVPTVTVWNASGILNTTDHPHAALLWLEFLASPEGQQIIDKYEPYQASVYTPGSVTEQVTRGKKLSVVDWDHFTRFQEYQSKIFEAYGFPKADK